MLAVFSSPSLAQAVLTLQAIKTATREDLGAKLVTCTLQVVTVSLFIARTKVSNPYTSKLKGGFFQNGRIFIGQQHTDSEIQENRYYQYLLLLLIKTVMRPSGEEMCIFTHCTSASSQTRPHLASFPGSCAWAENREPGTQSQHMCQAPLITCILLRCTKINGGFCLPAEKPHCKVILSVRRLGQF